MKFKQYLFINPALYKVLKGKLQSMEARCTPKDKATDNLTSANPKEGKHTNTTTKK